MTVKMISGHKVNLSIDSIGRITKAGAERGLWASGVDLRKAASDEIIRRPKSGRTYIRKDRAGRRRRHVASAPGESHANMTGRLRRALSFNVRSHRQLEFGYGVEASKPAPEYAPWVEFGTNRMKPRPSISNAIASERRNIISNLEKHILRELRK